MSIILLIQFARNILADNYNGHSVSLEYSLKDVVTASDKADTESIGDCVLISDIIEQDYQDVADQMTADKEAYTPMNFAELVLENAANRLSQSEKIKIIITLK